MVLSYLVAGLWMIKAEEYCLLSWGSGEGWGDGVERVGGSGEVGLRQIEKVRLWIG